MKKKLIIISTLMLIIWSGSAQNKHYDAGYQLYNSKQYHLASTKFLKSLKTEENPEVLYKTYVLLGNCYTNMSKPKEAAENYMLGLTYNDSDETDTRIKLANALKHYGNYSSALEQFNSVLKSVPDHKQAALGKSSCLLSINDTIENLRYSIRNEKEINTSYDEFAPVISSKNNTQIYFTSNRKWGKDKSKDGWNNAFYSDLYKASINSEMQLEFAAKIDQINKVNSADNEGSPFLNERFNKLLFTRCKQKENKLDFCKILSSGKSGPGWGNPSILIEIDSANVGHPCMTSDERRLFFVMSSDKNGTKDVWMASRKSNRGSFTDIRKLEGTLNTDGDELFPMLLNDSTLFFASNGHPGYGGLDIYKALVQDDKAIKIEHLPKPINSYADDFSICFINDMETGYFSSNRQNGKGGDDIYFFERNEFSIKFQGNLISAENDLPFRDYVINLLTQEQDTLLCKSLHEPSFVLDSIYFEENEDYTLIISKPDHFNFVRTISTHDLHSSIIFKEECKITPIPKKPILLPDILYDLDSWELQAQYKDSLNILVKTLRDNPDIRIELASHTDSRADNQYNLTLSQKRAQAVVDYLISMNIDPDRLVAKGYGEDVPRILEKEISVNNKIVRSGTILDEGFINSHLNEFNRESLHALNRRTEFKVIKQEDK